MGLIFRYIQGVMKVRKHYSIQSVPQDQKSVNILHNVISFNQLLQHFKHAAGLISHRVKMFDFFYFILICEGTLDKSLLGFNFKFIFINFCIETLLSVLANQIQI